MRILGPVVTSPAGDVFALHTKFAQCSPVGWQFVSHDGIGCMALLLQQFAHQFERCFLVSAGLNQNVEHLALAIHRPPQIHPHAVDGDKHLVKVPTPISLGAQSSQPTGIAQSELQRPPPHGLVRNIDTAFRQQILNIAKAERKSEIQPDCVLNDRGRKSVSGIGNVLHPTTVPGRQHWVIQLV